MSEKNHLATGQHLIIDACALTNDAFASKVAITDFFGRLIDALEMKQLGPLRIYRVEEPSNRGYTALQVITTSHIAFHADEIGRGFYLDVFSCRPFDAGKVVDLVVGFFAPAHFASSCVVRDIRGV